MEILHLPYIKIDVFCIKFIQMTYFLSTFLYNRFCGELLSNADRIMSSRKCIFAVIVSKLVSFGSFGSNLKTTRG